MRLKIRLVNNILMYLKLESETDNLIQHIIAQKNFHVSPFIEMDCNYFFRILPNPGEKIYQLK